MLNKCLLNLSEHMRAKMMCESGENSLKICPINSEFIIYLYHGNLEFNGQKKKRFDLTSTHLQCGLLDEIAACPLLYLPVLGIIT